MSISENIIGAVFLIIVLLGVGFMVYQSSIDNIIIKVNTNKNEFLYDELSTSVNTLLEISENESLKSYSDLISDSIYYNSQILNFSNKTINVSSKLKTILDKLFGKENYYLVVEPSIVDVSLNFVIDGSNSLKSEREFIGEQLYNLISDVKEKIKKNGDEIVVANIYILGDKSSSSDKKKCDVFNTLKEEISCYIIGREEIYDIKNTNSSNLTYSIDDNELYKIIYNVTPPYDNLTFIRSIRQNGEKDFYEADWGLGVGYVSAISKDSAKLVIIFPMSDELSTSSISQSCFNITNTYEQRVCDLCSNSCDSNSLTIQRAFKSVEIGAKIAKDNSHVVNPIYAFSCDYDYKPIFNTYFEIVYGTSTNNSCFEDVCGGCSVDNNGGVCFHNECEDTILNHMDYIAKKTGGKTINLNQISDLVNQVQGTVNENIDKFSLEVGENFNSDEVFVFRRSIPLKNKLTAEMILKIKK